MYGMGDNVYSIYVFWWCWELGVMGVKTVLGGWMIYIVYERTPSLSDCQMGQSRYRTLVNAVTLIDSLGG